MQCPSRPPAPPRSYTETVEEDVQAATSSDLPLGRTRSEQATADATDSPAARQPGVPSGSSTASPPASVLGESSQCGAGTSTLATSRTPASAPIDYSDASRRTDASAQRAPKVGYGSGVVPRAVSSLNLLVRDGPDSDDDEADFASDDESFRFRPPSVASNSTSLRSSRRGVRIEDWSERPNAAFVKDVKIPDYHTVGSESSGFVVFEIELQTLPTAQSQGTVMKIHKRYSAFVQLRHDLLSAHPQFRGLVPRLPPKSSLAKYRPSFLEKRRQLLGYWLSTVLLHPILGGTAIVRDWVLE
ncbi:hypothetical protein JCM3774_004287 [Rhodotorula dairenensis]